jgi:hypothetical protein
MLQNKIIFTGSFIDAFVKRNWLQGRGDGCVAGVARGGGEQTMRFTMQNDV